jgi:fatty acid desaturase
MFPLFGATHHYRVAHLAQHQLANDEEHEPVAVEAKAIEHWSACSSSRRQSARALLRRLWLPSLIRNLNRRKRSDVQGQERVPEGRPGPVEAPCSSKIALRVGMLYLLGLVGMYVSLALLSSALWLVVLPGAWWLAAMAFYTVIPARWYLQSPLKPVISSRAMTLMRITYLKLLYGGLAWITFLWEPWAFLYFFLLWIVPQFTSLSLFKLLSQAIPNPHVERSGAGKVRKYLVAPLIRFIVLPIGMAYHLPHHLFATVPHYRLGQLNALLLSFHDYRAKVRSEERRTAG